MAIVAMILGALLVLLVLWEGFETIILPRRVTRRFRITRVFYRSSWRPWTWLIYNFVPARRRETWLSYFGPLSLLLLLSLWAAVLIVGFALIHWGGSWLFYRDGGTALISDIYLSGTTFFTLGIGDVVPKTSLGRLLVVIESGMGFAFLALIISYLPALNQSFARREVSISLLDARAGSPPTASEMLRRHGHQGGAESLRELLHEWERWSAEFLEGHLSYPVLAYFRSQHDNQSWLAGLTAILDTCALIMAGVEGSCNRQAELTFAMSRHAVVDLALVFRTQPRQLSSDRLPSAKLDEICDILRRSGHKLKERAVLEQNLAELRLMYEPYVVALSRHFKVSLPPWVARENGVDNWQASFWKPPSKRHKAPEEIEERHF
ncbi:potassium channel family protein [Geomonas subterranea]|uniref:Potassium channel family protein n=1 Tax=Geomonas subterranea TaxID=2847989 RepID=A0ABX8LIH3_9BACT|nr:MULTISPECIES: potassium channel family protein [Geomonas]QXE91264.1 potassium channel family protein [Geomonas subterranea]QXM10649.1 potassium channel family protein [Geomonas subterranea]